MSICWNVNFVIGFCIVKAFYFQMNDFIDLHTILFYTYIFRLLFFFVIFRYSFSLLLSIKDSVLIVEIQKYYSMCSYYL